MASVKANGNAALLLDFLGHFDGVAVLVSRRRTLVKVKTFASPKRCVTLPAASGTSSGSD